MVVIRFGISAYAALSVNNYLCAREQAPSALLFAFSHNVVVLIPTTSAFPASVRKQKKTVFGRFLEADRWLEVSSLYLIQGFSGNRRMII